MKINLTLAVRSLAAVATWLAPVALLFVTNIGFGQLNQNDLTGHKSKAQQLLGQSARNLNLSPQLQCNANIRVNLFDTIVDAKGTYMQMGQGSGGAAKMEFRYGTTDFPQTILQICHRGYYYRFRTTAKDPKLEVIDLRRIADSDSGELVANPNAWMATGGLASLMQNLSRYFIFEIPEKTNVGDVLVWRLKGRWNEKQLKRLLFGQVRYAVIKDDVDFKSLPEHVPDSCELLLGRDEYFPLFPYSITFNRNVETDGKTTQKPIVRLELFELETNVKLDEQMFIPDFQNIPLSNLTDQFVERIENLKKIQRAANQPQPQKATR